VICCAGLLSKSIGQTLRVAASMHVVFGLEDEEPPPNTISYMAIKAAIDFVEVCCLLYPSQLSYAGNSYRSVWRCQLLYETDKFDCWGFNQPYVAHTSIELPGNAEKGFLWMFPKPVYAQFDTLEPAL